MFDSLGSSDYGCVCESVLVCVVWGGSSAVKEPRGGLWSQLLCTGTWPGACRYTHVTIGSLNLMNASRWPLRDPKSVSDKQEAKMDEGMAKIEAAF